MNSSVCFIFILIYGLQLTGVRLNNVTNDFIMLANTQFVENVSHTWDGFFLFLFLCLKSLVIFRSDALLPYHT